LQPIPEQLAPSLAWLLACELDGFDSAAGGQFVSATLTTQSKIAQTRTQNVSQLLQLTNSLTKPILY